MMKNIEFVESNEIWIVLLLVVNMKRIAKEDSNRIGDHGNFSRYFIPRNSNNPTRTQRLLRHVPEQLTSEVHSMPLPSLTLVLITLISAARTEVGSRVAIPRRIDDEMRMMIASILYYEPFVER